MFCFLYGFCSPNIIDFALGLDVHIILPFKSNGYESVTGYKLPSQKIY